MTRTHSIPENMRVYAIGDIHGRADLLDHMHELIAIDMVRKPVEMPVVVYLGDYIDRGLESYRTLDTLVNRLELSDNVHRSFLMGNHEYAILNFMKSPLSAQNWLHWGGVQTLESYGIEVDPKQFSSGYLVKLGEHLRNAMPEYHIDFLNSLSLKKEFGDYLFVHAGVHPDKGLEDQSREDLLMIREPFLSSVKPLSKCIVHGHTISEHPEVRPFRIGIDTGAYYTGVLSCAVLEASDIRFLQTTPE